MTLDALRTRFLYKPLDAVLASEVGPGGRRRDLLRTILHPRSSRYDRVRGLVGLGDRLLPGSRGWLVRRLLRPGLLPLDARDIRVIGAGSGSTVFLLETGSGRRVLKAYRRTLGARPDRLRELARFYQEKHETVSAWYRGSCNPVLPAAFLVLHGPLLGRPAVACLQPFLEGELRDVIAGIQASGDLEGGLPRLLARDLGLREQFLFFVRRTLEIRSERGSCVDLLGPGNLLITYEGGFHRLRLLDYGILDLHSLKREQPTTYRRIADVLSRLESLAVSLQALTEDSVVADDPD